MSARARVTQCRISLYADDVGIFTNPSKVELTTIKYTLDYFGNASVLITNLLKTEVFPICCEGIDLQDLLTVF